jgi:hypothetical protein
MAEQNSEYNPYDPVSRAKNLRKKILFLAIIATPIVLAFVWFTFLNFGKIEINAEPPFSVFLGEDGTIECTETPCLIELKPDSRYIGFFKLGYASTGETVEINLWSTTKLFPKFKREPFLEELSTFPKAPAPIPQTPYELQFAEETHNWKLTEVGSRNPLSFFPNQIQNPKILGSESVALIIERIRNNPSQLHYVGIKESTQAQIGTLSGSIIGFKTSPNGRYFYLKTRAEGRTTTTHLATSKALATLQIEAPFEQSFWTTSNKLLLVTSPTETDDEWTFSLFDPDTGDLTEIYSESFEEPLTSFHTGNQANKLYFKAGEQGWKLEF